MQISELEAYLKRPEVGAALGFPEKAAVELSPLGQGEYNVNFRFSHPKTGKDYVLRVNTGSQMHLADQIGYEYRALRLLEPTGRTPRAVYADGSRSVLPWGVLVMEYLPGRALDYRTDLPLAAEILADIHALPVGEECPLLAPERPLAAMLEECRAMAAVYLTDERRDRAVEKRIGALFHALEPLGAGAPFPDAPRAVVNTELNSGNFLINGPGKPNYLVDWEKPLLADPAQDLGHFLAPTTTFWKTDCILTPEEMKDFTRRYLEAAGDPGDRGGLARRLSAYLAMTCLRGVTWCAMAWVEYQRPDRPIQNAFTYEKICTYLTPEFLDRVYEAYVARDFLG